MSIENPKFTIPARSPVGKCVAELFTDKEIEMAIDAGLMERREDGSLWWVRKGPVTIQVLK